MSHRIWSVLLIAGLAACDRTISAPVANRVAAGPASAVVVPGVTTAITSDSLYTQALIQIYTTQGAPAAQAIIDQRTQLTTQYSAAVTANDTAAITAIRASLKVFTLNTILTGLGDAYVPQVVSSAAAA